MGGRSLNRISLFKDLARPGFHTSIITTFSVDAAFYDGSLFQRLRTYGCENTILLADKRMLDRAIVETPESFARAGVGYAVLPVATGDCFHPKLHIRLGADGGSLMVGSANATAAGWGGNREIVTSFEWWSRRKHADNAAVQSLVRKAYDFVLPWIEQAGLVSLDRKVELINRDASWLFEVSANDEPLLLEDGTMVDLLVERGVKGDGILRRFVDLIGASPIRRLIVISPYWDGDLAALRELQRLLTPHETVIALNARKPQFPIAALQSEAAVRFARVFDGSGSDRFIHAKAIVVEAEDHDHLLLGSANCSTNALGLYEGPASNVEASMYRRLSRGRAVPALGIDLSQTIDPSEITTARRENKPPASPTLPWPGSIEAAGKTFRWKPDAALQDVAAGSELKLGSTSIPFVRFRDGAHLLELPQLPSYPIIARIALADGRLTSPVLVNDELRLQQAAPGMGNRQLRAVLEKIELGESDLLDLAALASLIFSSPEKARSAHRRIAGGRSPGGSPGQDRTSEGQDYESPEAFRAAMEARSPSTGDDPRLNIEGPDEVSLFRIVMRGISDSAGPEDDLLAGENEPRENDDGDNPPPPTETPQPLPSRVFTSVQVERRRLDVFKAMKAFETHLSTLAGSELPVPRKITAETCFILRLMVEAGRRAMQCEQDGERSEIYALQLAPNAVEREDTFVVRAGRMLHRLWVGSRSTSALLARLQIGRNFDELPYDCFALVVISRWAAARCVMSMAGSRHRDLAKIVTKTAVQIWRATAAWPPVEPAAELELVGRLDRALGIAAAETDELLVRYQSLNSAVAMSLHQVF